MATKYEIIMTNGKQLVLAPAEVEFVDTVAKAEKSLKTLEANGGPAEKRIVNWRNVATVRVAEFE